jgi:hypothetical protein
MDTLFSTNQQRVLALPFDQEKGSFFTNELVELTKSGSAGVQRELRHSCVSRVARGRRGSRENRVQSAGVREEAESEN